MLMAGLLAAMPFAVPVQGVPTLRREVAVAAREVRVGDLVEGRIDPLVAQKVVARLPDGAARLALPVSTVARLLRNRLPAFAARVPEGLVEVTIVSREVPPAIRPVAECFESRRSVEAGQPLSRDALASTPCRPNAASPALRYDASSRAMHADGALAAGIYVGRVAVPARAGIGKGEALTLRSIAGPALVERQVTTLQGGRSGGRVFVRDSEGQVFAAPLLLTTEGEDQ